ncbi:hypothetical protein JKP88DRAFT_331263 [Tribonema minus]|uniref:Uncharacterized protein n=1 Tax=Tribonema minus TaxID=303371 RepID=A0A836C9P7_9STRA|nr:hypothetical protein JKP88DRAFT_331263 [Tribonema minus]
MPQERQDDCAGDVMELTVGAPRPRSFAYVFGAPGDGASLALQSCALSGVGSCEEQALVVGVARSFEYVWSDAGDSAGAKAKPPTLASTLPHGRVAAPYAAVAGPALSLHSEATDAPRRGDSVSLTRLALVLGRALEAAQARNVRGAFRRWADECAAPLQGLAADDAALLLDVAVGQAQRGAAACRLLLLLQRRALTRLSRALSRWRVECTAAAGRDLVGFAVMRLQVHVLADRIHRRVTYFKKAAAGRRERALRAFLHWRTACSFGDSSSGGGSARPSSISIIAGSSQPQPSTPQLYYERGSQHGSESTLSGGGNGAMYQYSGAHAAAGGDRAHSGGSSGGGGGGSGHTSRNTSFDSTGSGAVHRGGAALRGKHGGRGSGVHLAAGLAGISESRSSKSVGSSGGGGGGGAKGGATPKSGGGARSSGRMSRAGSGRALSASRRSSSGKSLGGSKRGGTPTASPGHALSGSGSGRSSLRRSVSQQVTRSGGGSFAVGSAHARAAAAAAQSSSSGSSGSSSDSSSSAETAAAAAAAAADGSDAPALRGNSGYAISSTREARAEAVSLRVQLAQAKRQGWALKRRLLSVCERPVGLSHAHAKAAAAPVTPATPATARRRKSTTFQEFFGLGHGHGR